MNGIVSLTGGGVIYNQQYALKQTDFGFLWLDTSALSVGHVQVESHCGVGQPPSNTQLYVIGDCNGITDISSSGNLVLARQLSGQCAAATDGCGGPRDDGHSMFLFQLGGTWSYLGDGADIPDSAQTTDPEGRTWTVEVVDLSHYIWHATR